MPDPTYVTIPDLTAATDGSIDDNLLLEAAIPNGGGYVSRKVTKGQLVADLKEDIGELSSLETEDKTNLVAAINEANQNGSGGIKIVSLAADMTDTDEVYLYNGTEQGYTAGHWYYYNTGTSAWTDGGNYTGWGTIESSIAANTVEMGILSFDFGGDVYTYNGSTNTQITIPNADSTSY